MKARSKPSRGYEHAPDDARRPVWLEATESFYKKLNRVAKQCGLTRYDALSEGLDALLREAQIRSSALNRNIKSPAQSEVFRRTMGQVSRNYWATISLEERRKRARRSAHARWNRRPSVFTGACAAITDTLEGGLHMACECIERREAGFYIVGSRVPLDRIIWEYRNGEDPETIRSHYPTLSLEQVNGAIAFYQGHRAEVEQAMEERRRAEDAHTAANPNPPDIKERFERMRRQSAPRRA